MREVFGEVGASPHATDGAMFRALGALLHLGWRDLDPEETARRSADVVWEWATADLVAPRGWSEGEFGDGSSRVSAIAASGSAATLYRTVVLTRYRHPPAGTERATVDLVQSRTAVELGVEIEHGAADRSVEHLLPPPAFKDLMGRLLARGAVLGRQRSGAGVQPVVGRDGVASFVDAVLLAPERQLPILLFTAIRERDGVFMPDGVDLVRVAQELSGLARIYTLPRVEDTARFNKRLRLLSAYDGAVRIYWPGFQLTDPPPRHPLYLRERLRMATLTSIIGRVVGGGARVYRPPKGTEVLLALRWRQDMRRRVDETDTNTDARSTHPGLEEELERTIAGNLRVAEELRALQFELRRANRVLDELRRGGAASETVAASADGAHAGTLVRLPRAVDGPRMRRSAAAVRRMGTGDHAVAQ